MYDDLVEDLNMIDVTVDAHVYGITYDDDVCLANAIWKLCEARDSGLTQFGDDNQMSVS